MKKTYNRYLIIGATFALILSSFGTLAFNSNENKSVSYVEEDVETCNFCELLKLQVGELPHNTYQDSMAQHHGNEPWSESDCFDIPYTACRYCYQILDHDGDGPRPTEGHYWYYCNGQLIWHIWCEDLSDPESCQCLDGPGCGNSETLYNYLTAKPSIFPYNYYESYNTEIN